ncbi:hypothetical protein ACKVEX_14160 [Rhodocyclaceae bacterium SMB388]
MSQADLLQARGQIVEAATLAVLRRDPDEWLATLDIAQQLQTEWRPFGFALRRLACRGLVDESIITVPGKGRLTEERRLYKLRTVEQIDLPNHPLYPTIYPIPPGAARRVFGRASAVPRSTPSKE